MMNRIRLYCIAACICFLLLPPLFAQDGVQEQKVSVRLRLVPFSVFDDRDRPVKGLTKDDFELFIDGAPVAIRSLDELDYSAVRAKVAQGQQPDISDLPPRRIIFLFDTLSSSLQDEDAAVYREAKTSDVIFAQRTADTRGVKDGDAEMFLQRGTRMAKIAAGQAALETLLPTDEVAIVEIGFAPRLIQSFTPDRAKIRAAIEQISLPSNILAQDSPAIDEDEFELEDAFRIKENRYKQRRAMVATHTGLQMTVYKKLADVLAGLPGAKHVILFSEGIPAFEGFDRETPFKTEGQLLINKASQMARITGVLASAGARVNSISVAGIEKSRAKSAAENSLANIAQETGGAYFSARARIGEALNQALTGMDSYYELFFSPPTNGDGEFHTVEVRVKRPGLNVRAPKGFYDERHFDLSSDTARQATIDRAFWQPLLTNELGAEFSAELLPFSELGAALHLRVTMPQPPTAPADGEYDLLLVFGRDNTWYDQVSWRAPVTFSPGGQVDLLVPLPPGTMSYQLALTGVSSVGQALFTGAYEVPAAVPAMVISPIQLGTGDTCSPAPVTAKPEKLSLELPQALVDFAHERIVSTAAAGDVIYLSFIYRGGEFSEIFVQLTQGTNQVQMRAVELQQTPLADGLRIVRAAFGMPAEWGNGPVEVLIAAPVGEKVFRLGTASLTIVP